MTNDELLALEPVQIGPNHFRNPFGDRLLAGDESVRPLATRWQRLHGWCDDSMPAVDADPFEQLIDSLSGESPFHFARDPQTDEVLAVFPRTAASEDEWEERSIQMHQDQRSIDPESLPEKLREQPTRPTWHGTLAPPDEHGRMQMNESNEPTRFEDSEESKKLRGLTRGD